MSVEIHAALVGGLLSGLVIFLTVFLSDWLRRTGDRKSRLKNLTIELSVATRTCALLFTIEGEESLDYPASGWELYRDCRLKLAEMRSCLRWPIRRQKEIRQTIDDLEARFIVA